MSPSEKDSRPSGEPSSNVDEEAIPDTVSIRYKEAPNYKTAYADGAQGGFTPQGYLFVNFYNDQPSFPDRTEHEVAEDGTLGDALSSEESDVVLQRYREFGVFLDIQTVQELHAWLGQKIELLKQEAQSDEI